MLIPHQGGAEILPGTGVPWGPPCSVHPRLPWPIATGRREGGWPGLPPLPDPACPAPGAGRHMPTCCRSRPKITTDPPKALPPSGAARKTRGLLGSSSALQLDGLEGGFFIFFFFFQAGKQALRHARQQWAGLEGGGLVWVRRDGCSQPQDAVPGLQPTDGDVSTSHAAPALAFAAPVGRMRGSSRGGPAGLAKAPARVRPRHALPPRSPGHGPSPGSEKGGGSFSQARGPQRAVKPRCVLGTCHAHAQSGGSVLVPGAAPDPPAPPEVGGGHTRGIKSCARIWAEPERWGRWQKRKAEPEGCRGCRNGAGPLARVHSGRVGGDAQRGNNPPPQGTELGKPHPRRAMVLG